jgi:uncharacterized protein (DUF2141 family)
MTKTFTTLTLLLLAASPISCDGCGERREDRPTDGTDSSANTPDKSTTSLTVRVTNLRNRKGHVLVSLFRTSEGFPSDADRAAYSKRAPIPEGDNGGDVTIRFDAVPDGRWAVGVLHDENDNGRLDKNFIGAPEEGYGASNNPPVRRGPPTFDDSVIELTGDEPKRIDIQPHYLVD